MRTVLPFLTIGSTARTLNWAFAPAWPTVSKSVTLANQAGGKLANRQPDFKGQVSEAGFPSRL
jgi:hypothetical protein